jgi:sugar phosphate isomerase/epimerase
VGSLFYAQDTAFFHALGSYDFDARCEILKELGYEGTYLCLWSPDAWADLPKMETVKEKYGLEAIGVYTGIDVNGPEDSEGNAAALNLLRTYEGGRRIELALLASGVANSDRAADEAAIGWLNKLTQIAEERDLLISLYPHYGAWLERVDHAAELCRTVDHPSLRLVFSGFHWLATDGKDLGKTLAVAGPYLSSVNICGASRVDPITGPAPQGAVDRYGLPAALFPLDEGDLDNFAVLGALREVGFTGPIGLLGYSVGGDVYAKLKRSIAAFRDIESRLDAHPEWARMRKDPLPMPTGG